MNSQVIPFMVNSNQTIDVIYHENGSLTNNENSYILLDNLGNIISHQIGTTTGSPDNTFGVVACENTLSSNDRNFHTLKLFPNPANQLLQIHAFKK